MRLPTWRRGAAIAVATGLLAVGAATSASGASGAAAPDSRAAASAAAAAAAPSDFDGVNWAAPGDNYASGPVVPSGLSTTDSYGTVYRITQTMVSGFRKNLGTNT